MSAEKKSNSGTIPEDLQQAINNLGERRVQELMAFRLVHTLSHGMLQAESRRLARKFGKEHPRVQRLEEQLQKNIRLAQSLRGETDFASIRVPQVADEDVLIHGRILDEKQAGVAGLTVTLEDDAEKPLEGTEAVQTDGRGYYALQIVAEIIEEKGETGHITVRSADGNLIHKEAEGISLASGGRHYAQVAVTRARVEKPSARPPKKPKKPKKPAPVEEEWLVRGRVVDQNGRAVRGVMVIAHDEDLKYNDVLGAGLTNKNGEFAIRYNVREFREGKETGPDLYVNVMDAEGKMLYSSQDEVRKDASADEEYKIVLEQAKGSDDEAISSKR